MMKKAIFIFILFPILIYGNKTETPSKIDKVIVYLNGASISRTATCNLNSGVSEITFTNLSTKIDETSIQVSGLKSASILSISYDINYLDKTTASPESKKLLNAIEKLNLEVSLLKNTILGLEEEELVITSNRAVNSRLKTLDLEKIKSISTYYRKRITEIKNEIYTTNLKVNALAKKIKNIQQQLAELNSTPSEPQGEITIKFDSPIPVSLNLNLKYNVQNAGWIPNYNIKSKNIEDPLQLTYKAHVYQKTGVNWDNVAISLSTGNPNRFVTKPEVNAHYLNFGRRKNYQAKSNIKQKYNYNPIVRKVTGIVTDESGAPLPGCNVIVKGTSNGTVTDFDGFYAMDITNGQELEFSYIGFSSTSIPIYSSLINIKLEEDGSQLEEVIVVGYGAQKRSAVTGAVTSVKNERIGKSKNIRIRGASNVVQEQKPLYVIDGIPVEDYEDGDLDPNEIQSIDVLKDEASTAIYGSRGANGIVIITTKKSTVEEDITTVKFNIKKTYSIVSDGDITAIEINTFNLNASYEYFAAPILDENVFLTATFKDWEKLNLLPGEANIYFNGAYAGKTNLNPYTTKKEITVSMGMDDAIEITRSHNRNFKSKSFTGSSRVLDRTYDIEIKNNKTIPINLKLVDRIPISQNKEIKVDNIETYNATHDKKKGILTWQLKLNGKEDKKESFSYQVKYPRGKQITL